MEWLGRPNGMMPQRNGAARPNIQCVRTLSGGRGGRDGDLQEWWRKVVRGMGWDSRAGDMGWGGVVSGWKEE